MSQTRAPFAPTAPWPKVCLAAFVLAGTTASSLFAQTECSVAHRTAEGWTAYRANHIEASREAFTTVAEACPTLADAQIGLGYVALRLGDLEVAEQHFLGVVAGVPGHTDATKGLARVAARRGEVATSERHWRAIVERHPDDVEALIGMGQTARWQGKFTEAASWLARAEEVAPRAPEVEAERDWLAASSRPSATTRFVVERDSDRNRMITTSGSVRWSPWQNIELRWDGYVRSTTQGDARSRLAVGHLLSTRTRLPSGWSLQGGFGGSETSVLGVGVRPTGFLSVSSPSGQRWNAIIEARSDAFDATLQTIERTVGRRGFTVDVNSRTGSGWTRSLAVSAGSYTGTRTNGFWRSTAQFEREQHRNLRIGTRVRGFGFADDVNDGYFDPSWFLSADLPLRWSQEPGPWGLEIEVAPGVQRSSRNESAEVAFASAARGRYRLRPGREVWIAASWARSGAERLTAGSGSYSYRSIATGATWVF